MNVKWLMLQIAEGDSAGMLPSQTACCLVTLTADIESNTDRSATEDALNTQLIKYIKNDWL